METKLSSEIEKKMDVKTIRDFEKEVRTKIIHELEGLRKTNDNLSRILTIGECELWGNIRDGNHSWLKIKSDKKKKLFRLIDIYSGFDHIVGNVKELNKKVDEIKKLKDEPIEGG